MKPTEGNRNYLTCFLAIWRIILESLLQIHILLISVFSMFLKSELMTATFHALQSTRKVALQYIQHTVGHPAVLAIKHIAGKKNYFFSLLASFCCKSVYSKTMPTHLAALAEGIQL